MRIYSTITALMISVSVLAQESPVPPGMNRTGPHSFADEKEVAMEDWLAFVYHRLSYEKDTVKALEALPDTNCLPGKYLPLIRVFMRHLEVYSSDETMSFRSQRTGFQTYLLLDPEHKRSEKRKVQPLLELPVVCITHGQAMAFCTWRGEVLKSFTRFRSEEFEVRFRLPTLIEWENLAKTIENPADTTARRGCNAFHFAVADTCSRFDKMCSKYGPGTCGVSAYDSNSGGFWNLQGNVAEMTLTEGLAKGGSCIQPARMCMPDVDIRYEKPEYWLGFRCVAFAVRQKDQE